MMRGILACSLLAATDAAGAFEVFGNSTVYSEYGRRADALPGRQAREAADVTWLVGNVARRLTSASASASMEGECATACEAKFKPFADRMEEVTKGMTAMSEDETVDNMGHVMACLYDSMCAHKDAFKCLGETTACASLLADDGTGNSMSFGAMQKQMDCLCDACPEMIQGLAGMMQVIMKVMMEALGSLGQEQTADQKAAAEKKMEKDLMDGLCPLIPAIECSEKEPKCKAAADAQNKQVLDMFATETAQTKEQEMAEFKKNCTAAGAPMTLPAKKKYTCTAINIEEAAGAQSMAAVSVVTVAVFLLQ